VKGEEAISIKSLRALLKDFLQKVNVKGKVKKGKGKNLVIAKSKGKPIFCGSGGEWKVELEQRLKKDDEIVLFSRFFICLVSSLSISMSFLQFK
jgi:hypothetical protein